MKNGLRLIPAGVVLRRHQHQTRTRNRNRLRARALSEGVQDAEHGGIGGENSKSNRSNHGEEESDRHKKRNHDRLTFTKFKIAAAPHPAVQFFNLYGVSAKTYRVDAPFC